MDAAILRPFYQQLLAHLPKGICHYPPYPPFFTGYSYGTLYDWDQYFEALVQLYAGWSCDYIRNGIHIFLSRQQADGLIPRTCPPGGGESYYKHRVHVKPFLCQEALLCRHAEGQLDWLRREERYERLRRYLAYWLDHEDVRGAGLSVWMEAEHTGMDNHYERAGIWGEPNHYCEGVDLNAYLVRECGAMALLAADLGYPADAEHFARRGRERAAAIQRWLWDEEGLYYDGDARSGERIPVKHIGIGAALWAGVPTPPQAARMVQEHLLNPAEFWRAYPFPGLAASEPGYVQGYLPGHRSTCCSWRAHTWLPTNYYTCQGLRRYGFAEPARILVERTEAMFRRGPFAEYYASDSGIGTGLKPFWGWTCLTLFMGLELELGVDPTELGLANAAVPAVRAWLRQKEIS